MTYLPKRTAPLRFTPCRLALALAVCSLGTLAHGASTLPSGLQVMQGQATTVASGNKLTVTNSNGAILNWGSFSIGAQNAVNFVQPSSTSQVLNRVTGNDPSNILGSLSSNGKVWLLNPNGVLFGQGARVDVAGLVTSTLNLNDTDWSAGRYVFSGGATQTSAIVNQGEIHSASGGQVLLLAGAGGVRNEGLIDASGGQIVLAAGSSIELLDTAAPRFTVKVTAPAGEVLNLGELNAAGGRIDVQAATVNQQGIVRADALSVGPAGEIVINAGQRLTLAAGSVTTADAANGQGGTVELLGYQVGLLDDAKVSASGASGGGTVLVGGGAQGRDASVPNADAVYFSPNASIAANATGSGDGGHIVLWSNSATRAYGSLSATGGASGGNGGFIETSGGWFDVRPSKVDVSSAHGSFGTWLLDPNNLTITDAVSDFGVDASFTAQSGSATLSTATITSALNAGTAVTISTAGTGSQQGTIFVGNGISDPAHITVTAPSPGSLTMLADGDINLNSATISSVGPMNVTLRAGATPNANAFGTINISQSSITSGGGNIVLGGFGSGTTPTGGSFANAAPGGVSIANSSVIDAGSGSVTINGATTLSNGGIDINASSQINGATLVLNGSSPDGNGISINDSSLTSTGSMTIQGYTGDTTGEASGVSIFNTAVNAGGALTLVAAPLLIIDTSPLASNGAVLVQATQIYLQNTSTISSQAASGDAILIEGVGGIGADSFFNSTGATALSVNGGARWIVWAQDITDAQRFDGNNLAYDFTRHGVSGPADWAADAGNGFVSSAQQNATVFGNAQDKTYDGTAAAQATNLGVFTQLGTGTIAAGASVQFDSKDAGYGSVNLVDPSDVSFVDGAGKPIYGISLQAGMSATINRAPLSITLTAADKVYDASSAAVISAGTVTGLVNGENLTITTGGSFADKNVGTAKPVTAFAQIADGPSGDKASNYLYSGSSSSGLTANITPATLIVSGLSANNKVYDRTTAATLSGSASIAPISGDDVTLGGTASGSFADRNVGTAKPVSVGGLSLAGSDAGNYTISFGSGLSADITPLNLIVSGLTAQGKVYDGTTAATLSGTATVTPLAGDSIGVSGQTGQFSSRNVGSAVPVAVSGLVLSGPDAGNYTISAPTGLVADITPATLSYVADAVTRLSSAAGVPLDPLPSAYGGSVSGFVGGDTQAGATTGTLSFATTATDSSTAGSYAINGQGLSAQNYQFVQAPGNATALTISTPSSAVPPPQVVQSTAVALQSAVPTTSVTSSLSASRTSATSGNSGVLDLTPAGDTAKIASASTSSSSTSAAATTPAAAAASFAPVRIAGMSMDALASLLASRDQYKKNLFADAVYQLQENPKLADAHVCQSLAEAEAGTCLVTESIKRESQVVALKAAALAGSEAAQPESRTAAAPASPGAPAVQPSFLPSRRGVKFAALPQIERKVAVVVGVDDYADKSIPTLGNAVNDAEAVGKLFESSLGYETIVIPNATKSAVIGTLNRLALAMGPKDSVVIYYAGHGDVVEQTGQGYWLLSDADAKKPETWLSNADIGRLIAQIGASQVALISDSCYSGSLVSDERIRASNAPVDPTQVLQHKSVVVMSSGGNEPVSDAGKQGHSPFTWNLMNQLGQVNKWQPGGNVFERVRFAVARELPQRPQYGASSSAGHQSGGDYLFEQRQLDSNSQ